MAAGAARARPAGAARGGRAWPGVPGPVPGARSSQPRAFAAPKFRRGAFCVTTGTGPCEGRPPHGISWAGMDTARPPALPKSQPGHPWERCPNAPGAPAASGPGSFPGDILISQLTCPDTNPCPSLGSVAAQRSISACPCSLRRMLQTGMSVPRCLRAAHTLCPSSEGERAPKPSADPPQCTNTAETRSEQSTELALGQELSPFML